MQSWFDAFIDEDLQQQNVPDGLKESILHILDILENEIRLLDGNSGSVYLGGISQGMATTLCTVFYAAAAGDRRVNKRLGGLLGFCGWLPYAGHLEELIRSVEGPSVHARIQRMGLVSGFFGERIGGGDDDDAGVKGKSVPAEDITTSLSESILATPVSLGHGSDDAWVSVELGRQASLVLEEVMFGRVEWSEYSGAEGDGHWIKEPQGFDRILSFLEDGPNEKNG